MSMDKEKYRKAKEIEYRIAQLNIGQKSIEDVVGNWESNTGSRFIDLERLTIPSSEIEIADDTKDLLLYLSLKHNKLIDKLNQDFDNL